MPDQAKPDEIIMLSSLAGIGQRITEPTFETEIPAATATRAFQLNRKCSVDRLLPELILNG
jgi:hypothetical protein